jgi:hypothetical protein
VLQPKLLGQDIDRRPDPLHRNASLAEGTPDPSAAFPQATLIDYVRVHPP